MTWRRREKILASLAGALILVTLGIFLFGLGDSRAPNLLYAERARLTGEVKRKQKVLEDTVRDAKRLAEWQHRALPADPAVARSLYQNWLRELANRARFSQLTIDSKESGTKRDIYTLVSFTLHGHANAVGLTEFLYGFYSAGHLHQIRHADIKPLENSREVDVTLMIEALSLADADLKDQLCKESGQGLRLSKLDDYRDAITNRDMFSAHRQRETTKTMDAAEYTFVTGFTDDNGTRKVWLQDRMVGKQWILGEGGDFRVGEARGTVQAIPATREVIIDFDGHRRRLQLGDNLRGGVDVAEQEKPADKEKEKEKD